MLNKDDFIKLLAHSSKAVIHLLSVMRLEKKRKSVVSS